MYRRSLHQADIPRHRKHEIARELDERRLRRLAQDPFSPELREECAQKGIQIDPPPPSEEFSRTLAAHN